MEETFKEIKDCPGYYISDWGRIYSIHKGDFKVPQWNGNGYWRIELWDKGKRTRYLIHRLVAEYFLEDFDPTKDDDHINGIRTDNRAINLRCLTRSENMLAANERNKLTPEEEIEYALSLTQWWDDDE